MPVDHWILTPDKMALATHTWFDFPGAPHVLIVHGTGEHSGRYQHVVKSFLAQRWNVTTFDFRGHGLSSGRRVDPDHFDDYVTDLRMVFYGLGVEPERMHVLAHSMGGLVVIRALQRNVIHPASVVLSSPFLELGLPVPEWKKYLGRILVGLAPSTRFSNRIRATTLTHDDDVILSRSGDPLIERTVTARWFFATQAAQQQAREDQTPIDTPLMMLQAEHDVIVSSSVAKAWFDTRAQKHWHHQVIPSSYHEILNETNRAQTLKLIHDWHHSVVNPTSVNP